MMPPIDRGRADSAAGPDPARRFSISEYSVPFYFGGTSLLIVVSVTMDTVAQIHSHLLAHQYEGLIRRAKLRGRHGCNYLVLLGPPEGRVEPTKI